MRRLEEGWEGPRIELPLLAMDRGPALIAALERCLTASLENRSEDRSGNRPERKTWS
jgi:hypothetical protein